MPLRLNPDDSCKLGHSARIRSCFCWHSGRKASGTWRLRGTFVRIRTRSPPNVLHQGCRQLVLRHLRTSRIGVFPPCLSPPQHHIPRESFWCIVILWNRGKMFYPSLCGFHENYFLLGENIFYLKHRFYMYSYVVNAWLALFENSFTTRCILWLHYWL